MIKPEIRDSGLFTDPKLSSQCDLVGADCPTLEDVNNLFRKREAVRHNDIRRGLVIPVSPEQLYEIGRRRVYQIFGHFEQEFRGIGAEYQHHGLVVCRRATAENDVRYWALPVGLNDQGQGWMMGRQKELYEAQASDTAKHGKQLTVCTKSRPLQDGNKQVVMEIGVIEGKLQVPFELSLPRYSYQELMPIIGGGPESPLHAGYFDMEQIGRSFVSAIFTNLDMEGNLKLHHQVFHLTKIDYFGHMCGLSKANFGDIVDDVRRGDDPGLEEFLNTLSSLGYENVPVIRVNRERAIKIALDLASGRIGD